MPEPVFVYGTLKSEFGNHHVMQRAGGTFVKSITIGPGYTMYHLGGFPAVVEVGNGFITGDVYEVEDLDPLDILEGVPVFYYRKWLEPYQCWAYLMNQAHAEYSSRGKIIEKGCWDEV